MGREAPGMQDAQRRIRAGDTRANRSCACCRCSSAQVAGGHLAEQRCIRHEREVHGRRTEAPVRIGLHCRQLPIAEREWLHYDATLGHRMSDAILKRGTFRTGGGGTMSALVSRTAFNGSEHELGIDLTFLGTGTSTGVPVIGCDCEMCQSTDSRDKRLRSSVLIETSGKTILIDAAPDLREQMLRTPNARIDAVLFTHAHSDHTAGLDEFRRYNIMQKARIPVWAPTERRGGDAAAVRLRVRPRILVFRRKTRSRSAFVRSGEPFEVLGVPVVPIPIKHGWMSIVGFRFGQRRLPYRCQGHTGFDAATAGEGGSADPDCPSAKASMSRT